jgi:uncharacterized membrane protein
MDSLEHGNAGWAIGDFLNGFMRLPRVIRLITFIPAIVIGVFLAVIVMWVAMIHDIIAAVWEGND